MAEVGQDHPASESPAATALRLVATVGSPIAIGTGLLFYFGWVRASVEAKQLGYDTAILDWSIQDYLLQSVNVLFLPLMALAVLALLLVWLHQRLVLPRLERPDAWVLRLPGWLRWSWPLWVSAAVAVSMAAGAVSGLAISVSITLALLCALYGDVLERLAGKPPADRDPGPRPPERPPGASTLRALVLLLLAFSVFWNTERLARIMGEAYAEQIAAHPRRLLAVTVYSANSLELEAPGVVETRLSHGAAAYHYRYQGLRLVQRSGDRYLLIGERWDDHSSRVIVLRESDAVRMEFAPADRNQAGRAALPEAAGRLAAGAVRRAGPRGGGG